MQPDKSAAIERLGAMPPALRALPQWLVWRFVEKAPGKKPTKVPFYVDGGPRGGKRDDPVEQGSERDRKRLVPFEIALKALRHGSYHGVGFAFLPGDGIVAIDLDHAVDKDSGEISPLCQETISGCATYTERSPSGTGVHIIGLGQTTTFKSNAIGVEVYCNAQFFTCTGDVWSGTPADLQPIPPVAIDRLRELVEASRSANKGKQSATTRPAEPRSLDNDFTRVNQVALALLDAWVPALFPDAKRSAQGYRVSSKSLGRELEEDLSITSHGIKDFGVADMGDPKQGGRTAIDLVVEWRKVKPREAMKWLADLCGVRLTTQSRGGGRPLPPGEPSSGRGPPCARGQGGVVDRLLKHYALVRGTDLVWDGEVRSLIQVKNLRLLYGGPFVNTWLAHPSRRLIMADQIRFEPGKDLPAGCVNLFDKLPTDPVPCEPSEVAPMLDLLRHLTSLTGDTPEARQAVFDQVMRWCALIVQRPGAKIRFALVFHGPQGAGKNLFWDGFRSILGKYGKMVGQTELEDRFNGYMSGKLLLIGNEVVTRQELFHHKNKLKWVITDDEIPIRGMHQEVRWESNHANVVFLSNETQPLALEKDDRRHLVVYTPPADDSDLYLRVAAFLRDHGAGKFMHYLLDQPLGDFNEHTKPLMTGAKEDLIELGLKPAERFANEWLDGYLDLPLRVCSSGQLYRAFRRWCDVNGERFPPPQVMFTKAVERHVFEQAKGLRAELRVEYVEGMSPPGVAGKRKKLRAWVPSGAAPPDGEGQGVWLARAIDDFESHVAAFGRSHHAESVA